MSAPKQNYFFEQYLEQREARLPPSAPIDYDTLTYVEPFLMEGTFHVPAPIGAGVVPPVNPFAQFRYDMSPDEGPSAAMSLTPYLVVTGAILYFLWMRR